MTERSNTPAVHNGAEQPKRRFLNYVLWGLQVLLALLFVFAGVMKLVMPLDSLKGPVELPGLFIRFIGVAETLGGLGLILPGLLRIRQGLTALAAVGLVIIMIGAVVISLKVGVAAAVMPFVVGVLLAFIAYGRWKLEPFRGRRSPGADSHFAPATPR